MNRKESLLWALYQDLYPKYQNGEVDFTFLLHVWEQIFDQDVTGMEEIDEEGGYFSNLDEEFNL